MQRKAKYNARRTRGYDSAAEAKRADELKLLQLAGEISDLREQVPFLLIEAFTWPDGEKHRKMTYLADFSYIENGRKIVEEVKGYLTDHAKDKQKIFYFHLVRGKYAADIDEYRIIKV